MIKEAYKEGFLKAYGDYISQNGSIKEALYKEAIDRHAAGALLGGGLGALGGGGLGYYLGGDLPSALAGAGLGAAGGAGLGGYIGA